MELAKNYRTETAVVLISALQDTLTELGCFEWDSEFGPAGLSPKCEVDPKRLLASLSDLLATIADLQAQIVEQA